jgi:RNA polymerase sigma-70 factor (ECF subfamily)
MNDDSTGACEWVASVDLTESTAWAPSWDATGPALDVESEIEVRFAVLAARYGEMLRRFLRGLSHRPDVAEDLVQQLWLKLLEAARAGRFLPVDDAALRSYLFTAARNLFLDECVRKHGSSRTVAHDPSLLETLIGAGSSDAADSPDESCHRQQLTAEVHTAMQRLPESQRTVVRLWMDGASIESMVAATGACRDTVLSRKKYAFRRLRGDLGRRGVD